MLRQRIQRLIERNPEPKAAAMKICTLLEWDMGLEDNGWFEGDEELIDELERNDAYTEVLSEAGS